MSEEFLQTDPLFRYVLGEMTEAEQARIEEAYFVDPARQQELWAVFDDVAERFLQGELPPAEAQKFATRLHASPLLREHVANLHALLAAIESRTTITAPFAPVTLSAPSFWTRWFALPQWQWGGLAAAALLFILGLVWWNRAPVPPVEVATDITPTPLASSSVKTVSPTPRPVASSTPQATSTPLPPRAHTLATFFLLQETVRDTSNVTPLAIAPQVRTVELQLEVRPPPYPRYQVTVQTADGRTRTLPNLRPHRRSGLRWLTVRLRVADLTAEPFTVRITGLSPQHEATTVGTHTLQVEKK